MVERWRDLLEPGWTGRHLFASDMLEAVTARLADGFTTDELTAVLRYAAAEPWFRANGGRRSLGFLFGDVARLRAWLSSSRPKRSRATRMRASTPPPAAVECSHAENVSSVRALIAALPR